MPKSTRQDVINAAEELSHFTPRHQTLEGKWVCPFCWARTPERLSKAECLNWLGLPENHKPFCPWRILKYALANLD